MPHHITPSASLDGHPSTALVYDHDSGTVWHFNTPLLLKGVPMLCHLPSSFPLTPFSWLLPGNLQWTDPRSRGGTLHTQIFWCFSFWTGPWGLGWASVPKGDDGSTQEQDGRSAPLQDSWPWGGLSCDAKQNLIWYGKLTLPGTEPPYLELPLALCFSLLFLAYILLVTTSLSLNRIENNCSDHWWGQRFVLELSKVYPEAFHGQDKPACAASSTQGSPMANAVSCRWLPVQAYSRAAVATTLLLGIPHTYMCLHTVCMHWSPNHLYNWLWACWDHAGRRSGARIEHTHTHRD